MNDKARPPRRLETRRSRGAQVNPHYDKLPREFVITTRASIAEASIDAAKRRR
jgi:hypothetical protein